jgi:prevent-host-death family protein
MLTKLLVIMIVMVQVNIAELKTNLSKYLAQVEGGETVIVCNRNLPVAHLTPIPQPRKPRVLGQHQHLGAVPDDILEPIVTEEVLAEWKNKPLW